MLYLFSIVLLFYLLLLSTLLFYSNLNYNNNLIELISTAFSLLFLIIIISPSLIIILDFDLIIIPSFIIYSLGLQWAWQFNLIFLPINIGFNSYCDHYIISSENYFTIINRLKVNVKSIWGNSRINWIKSLLKIKQEQFLYIYFTYYLFDLSCYLLLPLYSFI